jgi:hypothetical protein
MGRSERCNCECPAWRMGGAVMHGTADAGRGAVPTRPTKASAAHGCTVDDEGATHKGSTTQ